MSKPVPYLSDEAIERDAAALLAEYAQARGVTVKPPIPIEDIIEKHLKLRFEFDDTHKLFGIPRDPECDADILGAIFFDEARIVIDESLDPEENSAMNGRYRFTLTHEAVILKRNNRINLPSTASGEMADVVRPRVLMLGLRHERPSGRIPDDALLFSP